MKRNVHEVAQYFMVSAVRRNVRYFPSVPAFFRWLSCVCCSPSPLLSVSLSPQLYGDDIQQEGKEAAHFRRLRQRVYSTQYFFWVYPLVSASTGDSELTNV